ncbi:hypothetical protein AYO44_05505 [Planctomycetaceae bacterium SCGC AG-212-F19]|nr:hypothetical protein AYO44_05505 [Planctomycetaceae bacterium SCGC AG-212-F19]
MSNRAQVAVADAAVQRLPALRRENAPTAKGMVGALPSWVHAHGYVLFAAILMVPSFIWIILDQSVWSWDAAGYGEASVNLYYQLLHGTRHWPGEMRVVFPLKAPGIVWFGQFFVPLGQFLGSIDLGLLVSIIGYQWITLILVNRMGREIFPELGLFGLLAGCLLVGSAPLFVASSHRYLTESLQMLGVAWIFHTAAFASRWDRLQILSHLIAAGSFAMLAKLNTPAYCFLPGLIALVSLWLRRRPEPQSAPRHVVLHRLAFFVSLVWCAATLAWYWTNWSTVYAFAYSSALGELSVYYGHRDTFVNKLLGWVSVSQNGLFTPISFWCVIGICGAGLGMSFAGFRQRGDAPWGRANLLVAASFLQVFVFLGVAAVSINELTRFVAPLLPAAALLCMAALAKIGSRRFEQVFAAIFLVQWVYVTMLNFGVLNEPRPVAGHPFGSQLLTDDAWKQEAERLVSHIANDPEGACRPHMVGVENRRLNAAALNYVAAKDRLLTHRSVCFATLDYPPTKDCQKVWQRLEEMKIGYFLTLTDEQIATDAFNQTSKYVAGHIADDAHYERESYQSDFGVVIYRRQGPK